MQASKHEHLSSDPAHGGEPKCLGGVVHCASSADPVFLKPSGRWAQYFTDSPDTE